MKTNQKVTYIRAILTSLALLLIFGYFLVIKLRDLQEDKQQLFPGSRFHFHIHHLVINQIKIKYLVKNKGIISKLLKVVASYIFTVQLFLLRSLAQKI